MQFAEKWKEDAKKHQASLQMFVRNPQPCTIYNHRIAYVDPKCPDQPENETWAIVTQAERKKDHSILLRVEQPAAFKVLLWFDSEGIPTSDGRRFLYESSIDIAEYEWDHIPDEPGEYECHLVGRATIYPAYRTATLDEVRLRYALLDEALVGKTIREIFLLTREYDPDEGEDRYERVFFNGEYGRDKFNLDVASPVASICMQFIDGTAVIIDDCGHWMLMREKNNHFICVENE